MKCSVALILFRKWWIHQFTLKFQLNIHVKYYSINNTIYYNVIAIDYFDIINNTIIYNIFDLIYITYILNLIHRVRHNWAAKCKNIFTLQPRTCCLKMCYISMKTIHIFSILG